MFFFVYKNTASYVQFLLRAFILASGLVLLSGCWRMGLYVYWYGLNYEKFFASYTAIFSLFIFVYLVIASFRVKRENIYRFIAPSSVFAPPVAVAVEPAAPAAVVLLGADNDKGKETFVAATNVKYSPAPTSFFP